MLSYILRCMSKMLINNFKLYAYVFSPRVQIVEHLWIPIGCQWDDNELILMHLVTEHRMYLSAVCNCIWKFKSKRFDIFRKHNVHSDILWPSMKIPTIVASKCRQSIVIWNFFRPDKWWSGWNVNNLCWQNRPTASKFVFQYVNYTFLRVILGHLYQHPQAHVK